MIIDPPVSHTVNASTDVVFYCNATTDPAERSKLKIEWRKNDAEIEMGSISTNKIDNSLRITQAQVSHSGRYTCTATNGLDSDSVTVTLTVKGKCMYGLLFEVINKYRNANCKQLPFLPKVHVYIVLTFCLTFSFVLYKITLK